MAIPTLAIGEWALRQFVPIVVWVIGLVIQGCSLAQTDSEEVVTLVRLSDAIRRVEIEMDNPENGLPCSVIYSPDADTREVIWHARFERGFCQRKADEALAVLTERGWGCRVERPDERRAPGKVNDRANVVRAWRCALGSSVATLGQNPQPPLPAARPEDGQDDLGRSDDATLLKIVERDLAAIGQPLADKSATSAVARGDLDDDSTEDAIVVLDHAAGHRMVMAYLGQGESYHLADVRILPAAQDQTTRGPVVDIEDGVVRLNGCCSNTAEPTSLILRNRKLTYENGG